MTEFQHKVPSVELEHAAAVTEVTEVPRLGAAPLAKLLQSGFGSGRFGLFDHGAAVGER